MKKILAFLFIVVANLSSIANATTVYFNNTECPSCVDGQAVVGNEWSSYGITVSNAYWYQDSRDTFDGMGLSVNNNNAPATITIAPASNGITFQYWVIQGHTGTYEAFGTSDNLLGSLTVTATTSDVLGTDSFSGKIASLEFSGTDGFTQVSTLTFNRVAAVPEPETYAMLLAGLGLMGFMVSRKENV